MKKKPAFKPYQQHQMNFLPINLDTLIPENHVVRAVDWAIEKMNTKPLFDKYEGGGTSSYHPLMMLKVIIYAYVDKTYSCRKIAKASRENVMYMWLTGNKPLDFMTINRFRSERMKNVILDVFTEVVNLLLDENYIKEASKKWKSDATLVQNWSYDEQQDRYTCGYGRPLVFMWEKNQKSDNNYKSRSRVYECLNCSGCPYREKCVKAEDKFANRRIYINHRLNELKLQARELLCSEKGVEMRSLRPIEVESVFGDIKNNFGVRRFLLRGLEKVTIEWGLYSIAHNMRKMATMIG